MTPENLQPLADLAVGEMLRNDAFSQWLGIAVVQLGPGYAKICMTVRPEMLNGLGIVHGGVAFSLADSCFAFACNSRNNRSVALDTAINFLKPIFPADRLVAEAREIHNGRSTGLYQVTITNQHDVVVALFKGTCFRTGQPVVA
jgi:acyl-CoA thioesterase